MNQRVADAVAAEIARSVVDGNPGVHRLDIVLLRGVRDHVHAVQPDLFDGAEVVLAGRAALIWMPKRPRSFLQLESTRTIGPKDVELLPGVSSIVGSTPAKSSVAGFWREELFSRANLAAWILVVGAVSVLAVLTGTSGLHSILGPLSVYFAVSLPVLPLFFRPAAGVDVLPFFLSGRLARWQTAETQLFRVSAIGLASALVLEFALPLSGTEQLALVAHWVAAVVIGSAAAWLLLGFTAYALPLQHALDTARGAREYREWRTRNVEPSPAESPISGHEVGSSSSRPTRRDQ